MVIVYVRRLALEAKARVYEEMSKGRGLPGEWAGLHSITLSVLFASVVVTSAVLLGSCADEELNRHGDLCLVDFDRKIYEQVCVPLCLYACVSVCMRVCMHACVCVHACVHACVCICVRASVNVILCVCVCLPVVTMVMIIVVPMQIPPSSTDDRSSTAPQVAGGDEWVEYVDRLGRTRKCLKTDLPELAHLDKEEEEGLGEGQGERLSTTAEESRPAEEHYQTVLHQGEGCVQRGGEVR